MRQRTFRAHLEYNNVSFFFSKKSNIVLVQIVLRKERERERDYVRSLSLSLTLSECVSREAKEERYEENV